VGQQNIQHMNSFSPLVRDWFLGRFGNPTEAQKLVWPVAGRGEHLLLGSPTGTGKTLAAFLCAIDALLTGSWPAGKLSVLYVSPLKALNRDIRINLMEPLEEIYEEAEKQGLNPPRIRVETRSGDTSSYRRRRMLQKPPEILITTPESLNILLASSAGRSILSCLRCVILDEIHAVSGNRRGTHLMSAVERLVPLSGEFQRLALSATLSCPSETAHFVAGFDSAGRPRPVRILQAPAIKKFQLRVESIPEAALVPDFRNDTPWKRLATMLKPRLTEVASTLVFVNSRRMAEKIAFLLNDGETEPLAYAHHGSLSPEIRGLVEERLRNGALRCIVATNSLELGIDIGYLDQIILVQTPFTLSSAVQKIGRAGHRVGAVSRAILYCSHGRDLLDALALGQALKSNLIEEQKPLDGGIDVLAQIILAESLSGERDPDCLFALVRRSYPYRELTRSDFDAAVGMLEGYHRGARIPVLPARLRIEEGLLTPMPSAAPAIYSSGGTIPDRAYYSLVDISGGRIGELDEEFVWERRIGDVFSFASRRWRITAITPQAVKVLPCSAPATAATFFRADPLLRDYRSFGILGELLLEFERQGDVVGRLRDEFNFSFEAAEQLFRFLGIQAENGGMVHRRRVVAEYTSSPRTGNFTPLAFIHTFWGGRCNAPLGLALEAQFRRTGIPVSIGWDNDSLLLLSTEELPRDVLTSIDLMELPGLIEESLAGSGLFGARFRECAGRALILTRAGFNRRTPLWLSRIRAKRLFSALSGSPDFLLFREASRECLEELFDLPRLFSLLEELRIGSIEYREIETDSPSPLCRGSLWDQINFQIYGDDRPESRMVPGGEWASRIAGGELLRPRLEESVVGDFIRRLRRTAAGYRPETGAELEDLIRERVVLPEEEYILLLSSLTSGEEPPAGMTRIQEPAAGLIHSRSIDRLRPFLRRPEAEVRPAGTEEVETFTQLFRTWLYYLGPLSPEEIIAQSPFDPGVCRRTLAGLEENEELVSDYISSTAPVPQLMHRDAYEMLLGFSRARYRLAAGAAVTLHRFPELLAQWQGIGTQREVVDTLSSLEGYPIPAALWEKAVLPSRHTGYRGEQLDRELNGRDIFWRADAKKQIAFFLREDLELLPREHSRSAAGIIPGPGAFSFRELAEHTGLSGKELSMALWKAVWQGAVTADSFQPLREGLTAGFRPPRQAVAVQTGRRGFARRNRPPGLRGNWYRVPVRYSQRDSLEALEAAKELVRLIFTRYPVLFRELLHREQAPFRWRDLFTALRLMEFSGEVVSGSFIEDVPGLQFTLPAHLERISAFSRRAETACLIHVNDPASLAGIPLAGLKEHFPARRGDVWFVQREGKAVLSYSAVSGALNFIPGVSFRDDLQLLTELVGSFPPRLGKLSVRTLNGLPADEQPESSDLTALGFLRGLKTYTLWPSSA
jgi:ATP-dependent helicase Lhr and Lhr-like helicase